MLWCIAQQGQRDGSLKDMMQAMFWADFNHDDPKLTLVIVDAYPQGTRPQIGMITKFAVPPNKIVQQQVAAIVLPIIAKKGKPWVGRFILVDQFQRKYKTKKMSFRWAGQTTSNDANQGAA
jgi:hypothetical protein